MSHLLKLLGRNKPIRLPLLLVHAINVTFARIQLRLWNRSIFYLIEVLVCTSKENAHIRNPVARIDEKRTTSSGTGCDRFPNVLHTCLMQRCIFTGLAHSMGRSEPVQNSL